VQKEHLALYPNYVCRPQRVKGKKAAADGKGKTRGAEEPETDGEGFSFVMPVPAIAQRMCRAHHFRDTHFNGVKRNRGLCHQRLSNPNLPNDPYPDRTGRDFDQDSVGGPRRRSFYFAEDSLHGQPHIVEQSAVPMAQAQTQYVLQYGFDSKVFGKAGSTTSRSTCVETVCCARTGPRSQDTRFPFPAMLHLAN
jgi:hypothetical protein